ncbi:uncharacterized protein LOC124266475 [Haliotis rubra]|uniref:uncharacterized protein LOC124266475 n=1 Tax=Haliotis rubra TaxID=36100 RepID=UPI001EE5B935|nr:uncharacterized protein LOC124266475 [Haliotis rubra]
MWLTVALIASGILLVKCDKVTIRPVPLSDLKEATPPKMEPHFMLNGVDDSFINQIDDLHKGHSEIEAKMERDELNEFLVLYKHREKQRTSYERNKPRQKVDQTKRTKRSASLEVPHGHTRRKRFFGTWMLWEKGIVPYSWGNTTAQEQASAKAAMEIIHKYTCVRFVLSDGSPDFNSKLGLSHTTTLTFLKQGAAGCWSRVGMKKSGIQEISACSEMLTSLHEICHAMGAYHEHISYNRDGNIEENPQNIKKGAENNFQKRDPAYRSFFNMDAYDLQSLMHYEPHDFSSNGMPTLDPLYRDFAEPADDYWLLMKEMSKVYKCMDMKCPSVKLNCSHEGWAGYYDDNCQCVCPAGLDPTTQCTTLKPGDCGGIIELSREKTRATFKSPSYNLPAPSSSICTWIIKSPGIVMLKVQDMNLEGTSENCKAHIRIRRNLLGQSGTTYCGSGFQRSLFSTGNYMAVTLTTENTLTSLFLATAEALFAEDSCYNWDDRGETYSADLQFSEKFHKCVNWSEATACNHSPFSMTGDLKADYTGNSCRNPGGVLHRPWCYTDVKPTSCTIRYCEPCQEGDVYDVYDNCGDILRRLPDFCTDPEAEHGCRKTCGFMKPTIQKEQCGVPPAVNGARLTVAAKDSYDVNDVVMYQCLHDSSKMSPRWCLSNGVWSDLQAVCGECVDQKTTCLDLLKNNRTMCSTSPAYSTKYCSATCGTCSGSKATCSVKTPTASSRSVLVTNGPTVSQGQFVQYKCSTGFFKQSGDAELVCLMDGTLFGDMLVCGGDNKATTPVSDLEVKQMQMTFMPAWAFIAGNQYTNITRAGALKTWYFYCVKSGLVKLGVFRDVSGGAFVVGVTEAQCDAERLNIVQLSGLNEIYVKENDYIGALDVDGGALTYSMCSDQSTETRVVFLFNSAMLSINNTLSFMAFPICAYVALNADVGETHLQARIVNYKFVG